MKIRYMSDLHLEFFDFDVPVQEDDKDQVLVLAGDIGVVKHGSLDSIYVPFLARCAARFRAVVMIAGNHEHYRGSFQLTIPTLRKAIEDAGLTNVFLLEKQTHVIDDVAFIGATLWTDCDNRNPYAQHFFAYAMNDSKVIRTGPSELDAYKRQFAAADSANDHSKARSYILAEIKAHKEQGRKTVVVVHHGVTAKSIHPKYANSQFNMFFSSEMTPNWMASNPDYIIHGHTHESLDYFVDDTKEHCQTRVLVNPRGYVTGPHIANAENLFFDPNLTLEL